MRPNLTTALTAAAVQLAATALPSAAVAVARPSAGEIAFTCVSSGRVEGICLVRSDGTGFRRLDHDRGRWASSDWGDSEPAWSPDGRRLAWIRTIPNPHPNNFTRREVFVAGADGGNRRRLTRQLRYASSVSWVDNDTVTYTSDNEVWQVDLEGTPQRLHRGPFRDAAARPGSPEVAAVSEVEVSTGGWYAICSSPVCTPATQLYLLQPGAADVQLTDRRNLLFSQPVWRPDGQALAAGCTSALGAAGLCEVTRQGIVKRLVTIARGLHVAPAYAPDGNSIIYVHGLRRPRMRILDIATKRWRPLRDGADPAWRPVPR